MRFVGALACFIVALDSYEKATGIAAQTLFSGDYVWMWWLAAIGWTINGIGQILLKDYA